MKALGEFLRQAREAKGLSLQDIQEVTKIRLFFLESMENGDFDALPGKAYVKGFLRNYATAVGISEQEVMDRYNQLTQAQVQPAQPEVQAAEQVAAPAATPAKVKRKSPKPKLPSLSKKHKHVLIPLAIIILGIAAGVWGSQYIVRYFPKKDKPVTSAAKTASIILPRQNTVKRTQFADSLRAEATEDVWINLTERNTGRVIEEVTLHKGDTREWKLDSVLVLRNGNAGGLKLSDKGRPFKCYGAEGEVVSVTFTPQGQE